jgi:hypothetical protein
LRGFATSYERTDFMNNKTRSATPRLIAVSFALFAGFVSFSALRAIAQSGSTGVASNSQSPCKCWIDVKTGKRVGSVPTIPKAPGVAELSADGKTAFDPITKRNFALVPCPPRAETIGDTLKKVFESVHIGIGGGQNIDRGCFCRQ